MNLSFPFETSVIRDETKSDKVLVGRSGRRLEHRYFDGLRNQSSKKLLFY